VKRTYATLDGLRGIAALSIVVLHCHRYFGDMAWSSAAMAVDLFFVLSGFVLAHAYEAKLPDGRGTFLKARFIRLYPLYLVGTLLGIVEALLTIRYGQNSIQWTWDKFWTSLPFALAMLPAPDKTMFPFNGVMWSIFFELFVNVLWALFWRPLRSTRTLAVVVILSGIGLALSVAYTSTLVGLGTSWGRFGGGVFRVCFSFFLGVLFYRFHRSWKLPALHPLILFVGLPAVLFLPLPVWGELAVALFVLPWFVLLGSQVEPRGIIEFAARKLGLASYAVYAVHKRLYPLTYAAALQLLNVDLQVFRPWVGIVFVVGLLGFCLALNHYVDAPARKWLTARFGKPVRLAVAREEVTQAP
jgi:peptidoglycan/LPS O-acetylase OafA/YrhL